ncbi:MAG: N-acetyltransferase [Planctomycetota bacterium]
MKVRKARMGDVEAMHELINRHAKKGSMLARSRMELYENLRDFFVAAEKRRVFGTAALHISWESLAEVKSVAVCETAQTKGLGRRLLRACMREAAKLGARRVFVLTYVPDFFEKAGFKRIDRADLPHRIWAECVRCPEFPDCGEIPMAVDLPKRRNGAGRTRAAGARKKGRRKRG